MQFVYSIAPADWAGIQDESDCILQGANTIGKIMNPTILLSGMSKV